MEDFEKIEYLLLSKKYEELSPAEVREVGSYFGTSSEYNDMRDTLLQVKTTLAADKILIKPSIELKEKLLQQFENTYTQNTPSSTGNTRPFFKRVAVKWSIAAGVFLLVSLSVLTYVQVENLKKEKQEDLAMYTPPDERQPLPPPDENTEVMDGSTATEPVTKEDAVYSVGDNTVTRDKQGELRDERPRLTGTVTEYDNTSPAVGETYGSAGAANDQDKKMSTDDIINESENTKWMNTQDLKAEESTTIIKNGDGNVNGNEKGKNKSAGELKTGPDKSVHIQNQSLFNTAVNFQETTPNKDYYKRKKDKPAISNGSVSVADSLVTKTDSVNVDSNKNINLERRANSKMPEKKVDQ